MTSFTRVRAWVASVLMLLAALPVQADEADLATGLAQLKDRSFKVREDAVTLIARSGHERVRPVLKALAQGDLYHLRADDRAVIAPGSGAELPAQDALTGEDLGAVGKSDLKKIGINNQMRFAIRGALAELDLSHKDPARRLAGVQQMFAEMDADLAARLRTLLDQEPDAAVRTAMSTAVALSDLAEGDESARLTAVATLSDSLDSAARNALTRAAEAEPQSVAKAARKALKEIEFRLQFYELGETLFFGLSLGSVLVLAAIGLAITFGVMGVINMAHGELIMLGAYTTYIVQQLMPGHIDASLLVAVPAAFLVSGLVGVLIEQGVIRFLYGRPLETLLATFGVSLILQQLVRTLISPQNVPVENPSWMAGSVEINGVLSLTLNRLYILVFALLVFAALLMILKRTSLGLQVRAVSQNRAMARAMGVRSAWVDALTFGLGSGIAGVAGVALSQLTNVGPNLGQAYIIDSFMVVVFGGVGNLWGTLVGGLSLGVANKFLEPWAGAVLAKILVLVLLILFIQKRPRGLFPQRGRAAEG